MKDEVALKAAKWTILTLAGLILMVFMVNSESFRISHDEEIEELQYQVQVQTEQIEVMRCQLGQLKPLF